MFKSLFFSAILISSIFAKSLEDEKMTSELTFEVQIANGPTKSFKVGLFG